MQKRNMIAVLLVILVMTGLWSGATPGKQVEQTIQNYRISGPYTHRNLTLFLIHGKDQVRGDRFFTLQEALDQKKAAVYETGSVNELMVENRSTDHDIYIQSGEIVKGGRQDRVLGVDLILPPKSGKISISAFCVEHGRWSQRESESAAQFQQSTETVPSKELKKAIKEHQDQQSVWREVATMQSKLENNLGKVNSDVSASSLQLTLENEKVETAVSDYEKDLDSMIKGKEDVIGFAFSINGKINSADVYASQTLFRKLWPKLLRASCMEAVSEIRKDKPLGSTSVEDLKKLLAEQGKEKQQKVTDRVTTLTRESEKNIFFETRDQDTWIHRNYISKDQDTP